MIDSNSVARGDNFQARVDFNPNKHWKTHVLYETQVPGDFYAAQRTGFFLRFEMAYQITKSVKTAAFLRAFGMGGSD